MRLSDVTASPAFEDVRRTAVLEALARGEFAPGTHSDEDPAEFRPEWSGAAGSGPPFDLQSLLAFATACLGGRVDSSPADPASRLIHRIMAATRHDEIIGVLPLLGIRAIADRLGYALARFLVMAIRTSPPMGLDSLRELALWLREGARTGPIRQIGRSVLTGLLQAECRVIGGILAMNLRLDGFIQFAAISRTTGGHPHASSPGNGARRTRLSVPCRRLLDLGASLSVCRRAT